jgi:hypothetical protein
MAAAKSQRLFVKSADTTTRPANSRAELDKMLRRYGASAISISEDIGQRQIVVSFIVPNSAAKDAVNVPVKIPVSIAGVYDSLYGRPMKHVRWDADQRKNIQAHNPAGYDRKKLEQAERVAWRNLVLWVDAALSAAVAGLQTISEAFFAHAIVGERGERMVELVEAAQSQLGIGVQRLLAAPAEEA